jgi:Prokaryotic E2 family D
MDTRQELKGDEAMTPSERLLRGVQTANEFPRLEFRDGQCMFAMTNHEGGRVERFISTAAVKEAFTGVPIDSGWLDQRIVRWGNGKMGEWAVAFFAPAVYELELTRENAGQADTPYSLNVTVDHIRTPLPGLVFFGIQGEYYIWAVKTETLEVHQEVYRCPLPNVEADGKICWGPFKPPRCSAKSIFEAFELFIKSTFNNHRANGKSKAKGEDVRLMLRGLADVTTVRASSLRPEVVMEPGGQVSIRAPLNDPKIEIIPTKYPVGDLVRQVDHKGATLDQAILGFFESGEMPS